jgi:non-specific serine/threonine protein kinase
VASTIAAVDARSAVSLLAIAEKARTGMRASDSAALETVEARYPEIREAMDWCLEHGHADDAYRFATALVPFWMATKRIDEGDRWFTQALDQPVGSEAGRARATYDHGYLVFWAGRYDLADARCTEARAMAASLGDHDLEALALAGSARVALNQDLDEAIRLLREAVVVTADMPDSLGRSSAMHVLGVALQMSGDLAGARDVMTERLERGRAQGNASIVYIESANLSMVERQLGNLDAAEALSLEALRTVVAMQNELAIPWVINGLAAVAAAKSDLDRSATLLGVADGLLERAGGEWPPDERKQHDDTLVALRAGVAAAALEARLAAGRSMTLEDGVGHALGGD